MKATVSQPNIALHDAAKGKRTYTGPTVRVGNKADRGGRAFHNMSCLFSNELHGTGTKGESITEAHQFPAIPDRSGTPGNNVQKFSAKSDGCPANAGHDNRLSY